jgi:hypothetical protein
MGRRVGHAGIPFAAIGAVPFQRSANAGVVGLVFTGVVLHIASIIVWSFLYVWIVQRVRRPAATAVLIAAANFFCSWLVAWSSGNGVASVLPLGDRLALAVVLAAALLVGMRYAFFPAQNAT